jgi:hypothetical protein
MKALSYIEIDVDYCSRTYGSAPCTASIPTTGAIKCFNTIATCQDRPNFNNAAVTLRYSMEGRDYQPASIEAIPCILDVSFTPGTVSLGRDLGVRATLAITFRDFRHSDTGSGGDKYLADRTYNPYTQGTYWGKFRSRQRHVQGRALRWYQGELGDALADMTKRNFVIESFSGPNADGTFQLIAKDILKLADSDRAQAPVASTGRLLADITSGATTATLTPTGIGAAEYAASGSLCIGGKEVVSFTRSGDVLTLTRAQNNTTAVAHKAADRVQTVLVYAAEDVFDILYSLLVTYASVPASYISLPTWTTEVNTYLGQLYTGYIVEPTGVAKLVSELIEQAALVMWWDDVNQLIRLQVLRGITSDSTVLSEENVMRGSLRIAEQPEKRASQVWTFFSQRDPTKSLDDEDNYSSVAATISAQRETDYGAAAIRKIYSRWIPNGGRSIATRLNDIVLARFGDPPRRFELELFRDSVDVSLGGGHQITSWALQDATGAAETVPVQIVRLNPQEERTRVELEEVIFDFEDSGLDPDTRVVTIDSSQNNVNLKTIHDSLYPVITTVGSITLLCVIETGIVVGSASTSSAAFTVSGFTSGLPITVEVRGRIQGAGATGGAGKTGSGSGGNGNPGGTALVASQAINLILNVGSGQIWGGGGGGGGGGNGAGIPGGTSGGGGGGGAGTVGGTGADGGYGTTFGDGTNGTTTAGGAAGLAGGAGGGPGIAGTGGGSGATGGGGNGGAAGGAIVGIGNVTKTGTGDIRGTET